jgi:NAD(P)-dependent dehydrogenase (short-subunit alcohol dehydrogenase family)
VIHDVRDGELPQDLPDPEVLICNAGTLEEADAIDVNLLGTMRFAEHFVDSPALRSILFVASASARNGAEFPRYVASKAGIVGYMKNLALAVAKRGITCNSVSPGGVLTSSNQHILDDPGMYEAVLDETLLGKWAEPQEVAELVYFLTVTNRSITGEDILMDNGEMLKSNFIW